MGIFDKAKNEAETKLEDDQDQQNQQVGQYSESPDMQTAQNTIGQQGGYQDPSQSGFDPSQGGYDPSQQSGYQDPSLQGGYQDPSQSGYDQDQEQDQSW